MGSRVTENGIQTLIEFWNGSSWTVVYSPNRRFNDSRLFGVSAVTYHEAGAVGQADNDQETARSLIESFC